MELHPDIYFSETEFEQAGLLHDNDSCTVASPSGLCDGEIGGYQQQQRQDALYSLPVSSCGLADRLQTLSRCWQAHWPGQARSPSLPKGKVAQLSSLVEDVTTQIPPVPEESLQRTLSVAHNEQPRSMPVGLTADAIRKQANRDHQKRFRMRQKVTSDTDVLCCAGYIYYGLVALNLPGLRAFHVSSRDLDRGHLYVPLMQRKDKKRIEKSRKESSSKEKSRKDTKRQRIR